MNRTPFQTYTFDELALGMRENLRKTVENEDVIRFAELSGDHNPIHLSEHFARKTRFGGLYTASLISAVIGMRLPGPGAVYISQTLNFRGPVKNRRRRRRSCRSDRSDSEGARGPIAVRVQGRRQRGSRRRGDIERPPDAEGSSAAHVTRMVGRALTAPRAQGSFRRENLPTSSGVAARAAVTGKRQQRIGTGIRVNQASPKSDFVLATDPREPPPRLRKAVYAIGNFDGVHLGHCAVITRTKALAARRGAASAVLTFEPHPADYFVGRPVVFRLTPFAAKAAAIEELGVDGMVCLHFGAALAAMPAEAFVEEILVGALDIGAAVVGWDFHFGKDRSGSPAFLEKAGARFGFDVDVVPRVDTDKGGEMAVISSTAARSALEQGDVEAAARRLGRPYAVSGIVIPGQKLGRTLGVPTANIALEPTNRLKHGIYVVRATVDGRTYGGVASFGVRPTVDNGAPLLETYLFDFSGDLYGREMRVEFVARIRDELRFDSLDALKAEMARDIERARAILAAR